MKKLLPLLMLLFAGNSFAAPGDTLSIDDTFTPQVAKWVRNSLKKDNPTLDAGIVQTGYVTRDLLSGVRRILANNGTGVATYAFTDADIENIGAWFPNLTYLYAGNTASTTDGHSFDHFKPTNPRLDTARIDYTYPITIDMSACPDLTRLVALNGWSASDTLKARLTSVDVTQCPKLRALIAYPSRLTSIDLTNNPELLYLELNNSRLTELDLTHNPKLQSLYINRGNGTNCTHWNKRDGLRRLDVSKCTELERIFACNHHLEELDLSNCTKLVSLHLRQNDIRHLDLSTNAGGLRFVCVGSNHLRSLDLSHCREGSWSNLTIIGSPNDSPTTVQTDAALVRQLSDNRIGIYMPDDVEEDCVTAVYVNGTLFANNSSTVPGITFERIDGDNYLVIANGTYRKADWTGKTVRYLYDTKPLWNLTISKQMYVDLTTVPGEETTGIQTVDELTSRQVDEFWYTLDGQHRRLAPTQKGVYIHNGKKIVIR